ncbi:MAG: ABC transporter permease [Gemmatimonadales bacterium]
MRESGGRGLPGPVREQVYQPARFDLEIRHFDRLARAPSAAERAGLRIQHSLSLGLLYLQCVWIAITDRSLFLPPPHSLILPPDRIAMLRYHLRHAVRRLLREPSFTLAVILTLALGVGANVAVFAVVEAVLLRPLPYPSANELVVVQHRDTNTGIAKPYIAIGDFVDLAQRQQVFTTLAAYGGVQSIVFGRGDPYRVEGLSAGPGLLELLGAHPVAGRLLTLDDSREGAAPVVMLGYQLWQERFGGDPDIIGKSIRLGSIDRQVVGIAARDFSFPPTAQGQIIVPQTIPLTAPSARKSDWVFAVGRLRSAQTPATATTALTALSRQLAAEFPQTNRSATYFAEGLRESLVGSLRPALLLLLGAVAAVLLIACANVANLLLVRALGRRREMSLRLALGAGRARLTAQMAAESFVLAAVAGVAGLMVATVGVRALVALIPATISAPGLTDITFDGRVLAFALGVTLIAAVVFGAISTLTIRSEDAAGALVTGVRASSGSGARKAAAALVAFEMAFAIVLLMGAGLIVRSFVSLVRVNPGFHSDHVITVAISVPGARFDSVPARAEYFASAFREIAAIPGVQSVGAAAVTPLTGNNWTTSFELPEHPAPAGEQPAEVGWQVASEGYFRALRIPLLSGRLFDQTERPGSPGTVIVSQEVQRTLFGGTNAVGRSVKIGGELLAVVGVVGDIRRAGLRDVPRADIYLPFARSPARAATLFARTSGDPASITPAIREILRRLEANTVLQQAQTLDDVASDSIGDLRLVLWLLAIFAATALTLAAVGIYGVMSYVVRQRTREIGTRIALGASRESIIWLVMREGGTIAAIGAASGLLLGMLATRWLGSLLYGVGNADPIALAGATVLLSGTALFACYFPARRAAGLDPARTLSAQ